MYFPIELPPDIIYHIVAQEFQYSISKIAGGSVQKMTLQ